MGRVHLRLNLQESPSPRIKALMSLMILLGDVALNQSGHFHFLEAPSSEALAPLFPSMTGVKPTSSSDCGGGIETLGSLVFVSI